MFYYTILRLALLFVSSQALETPTIKISLGLVRGHSKYSFNGREFYAFEGIPYAKPPIGALRFQEPLKIEPWFGIWDARFTHECIQPSTGNSVLGSEDCLYLNVYVPKTNPNLNEKFDVLINIHGGAFKMGTPSEFGPEYLMDRNIIYVNFNYRLGALGFLSTEDDVVSGNNGLKDQVLALKWIQNHIEEFGGNPKSVTLIGNSAGSVSVHLHYFSPLSRNLFHRGISQSGSVLSPFSNQKNPLKKANQLAKYLGCNTTTTKQIYNCLKERPANQIIEMSKLFSPVNNLPPVSFGPVIEKYSNRAFLTNHPYRLLEKGLVSDVPWVTTTTTEEGIVVIDGVLNNFAEFNERWNEILPFYLDYNDVVRESDKTNLAKEIKRVYFGDENVSLENVQSFIKLISHRYLNVPMEEAARMQAKVVNSPIHSYLYGYRRNESNSEYFTTDYYGVCHGDDNYLIYKNNWRKTKFKLSELSESDQQMKDLLLDFVTTFAKDGTAKLKGIIWEPVKYNGDFKYASIDADKIEMISKNEIAPTAFWNSLPIRENRNAIVKVKDEL